MNAHNSRMHKPTILLCAVAMLVAFVNPGNAADVSMKLKRLGDIQQSIQKEKKQGKIVNKSVAATPEEISLKDELVDTIEMYQLPENGKEGYAESIITDSLQIMGYKKYNNLTKKQISSMFDLLLHPEVNEETRILSATVLVNQPWKKDDVQPLIDELQKNITRLSASIERLKDNPFIQEQFKEYKKSYELLLQELEIKIQ